MEPHSKRHCKTLARSHQVPPFERIGDLLPLRWGQISKHGVEFKTKKTDAKIVVELTPDLASVIDRARRISEQRGTLSDCVFTTQDGQPYTYSGASTAWKRAVKRSGIKGVTFHDIRAKALTDVDLKRGIIASQRMGGHTIQQQTSNYIRHIKPIKTTATK